MTNPRALVVEDDKDISELYGRVLESLGFETEIIRRGETASARLTAVVPDCGFVRPAPAWSRVRD